MENLFLSLLNMSITASYAIVFVLIIRIFLKKGPKIYSYLLWIVPFARLILPVSFVSTINLSQMLGLLNTQYIPKNIGMMKQPMVEMGLTSVTNFVNGLLPRWNPYSSVNRMQIYSFFASNIWVIILCAIVLYGLISYRMLKRRVGTAVLVENGVYRSERIQTPFVLGFLKPKIYLPIGLTEEETSHVLCHERVHIARRDYLVKPIAYLVLALHWFNPLCWLAFALMSRDMEASCEEKVIKTLGIEQKKSYSSALLAMARQKSAFAMAPLAFGETAPKSRIKNILRYKKPLVWVSALALIMVLCSGAFLLGNPNGNIVYKNKEYGITLEFPGTWKGEYATWDYKGEGFIICHSQAPRTDEQVSSQLIWVLRAEGLPQATQSPDDYFYSAMILNNKGEKYFYAEPKNQQYIGGFNWQRMGKMTTQLPLVHAKLKLAPTS